MIIRIYAIDQAGNRIDVPSDDVEIKCTVGSTKHISGDTYEVSVDQAGQSQSCNAYWNDLVAQRFFDVDAVLFGGGLGDSNTALTMVSIIIFLFIAIMLVLIRKMKSDKEDADYWEDDDLDEFEDEDEVEEIQSNDVAKTTPEKEQAKHVPEVAAKQDTEVVQEESKEQLRARLAAEAKRTGVMQAAPGTEQGKTGWYIDSSGELTSWLVSDSGEWTRMS